MSEAKQAARFISFEGTEGVGKSTAIANLCAQLDSVGIRYIKTREPGGSTFAEQLRALLLDVNTQIDDDTELLLMFAARSDHVQRVILPALTAGQWVICDRFVDSSVAYQGYGRGQGEIQMLDKIDSLIANFVPRLPDLTLWLDMPVQEGIQRAYQRSAADRFEQEQLDFFERVYEGFYQQQQAHSQRIKRVDASGDAKQVSRRVWDLVQPLLS
ncbi:dTMP kinase [Psychrobacter lutiphocae]|uniref:dTMP kinase n=1 Tax=Psychrobacter lutiphocae TaxID=540500 RepID=UPI000361858E|nr:dTMP kinase [Psychrobacter lutiphocae]